MATETQLKQLSLEAEKQINLIEAGMINTKDILAILEKIRDMDTSFKGRQNRRNDSKKNSNFEAILQPRRLKMKTGADSKRLQKQFNLLTAPHYTRVLQYLKTGDPKVFDGLKRKP